MALRCTTLLLATVLLPTTQAHAALTPASVIVGPSSAILDVDGAAMAPDGSGGIVFRELVENQPHLFVARFVAGQWQAPVQVDGGQRFAATSPTIAAGDGGRLLVVWVEPWAVVQGTTRYQLMSAELPPGSETFGPAMQIDPKDIGDGSAAFPSLAMAPNGQADVAYRVVTNSLVGSSVLVPRKPGDELISVRVARYNGQGLNWTSLGQINIHPSITMRHPNANNGPVVGIDLAGNAVVAWQEPDSSGTARIWARRLFGSRLGNPLEVSPESSGAQQITAEADAPAIAVNGLGEARIAYRLAGGPGSPYGGARIMLNTLPSEVSTDGAKLQSATPVAGGPALGPPSVAIDEEGAYRLTYTASGDAWLTSGDNYHPSSVPSPLGPAGGERAVAEINPNGGGVTAWPSVSPAGLAVVDARQDYAGAAWQLAGLSAPLSGPVAPPVVGGSGQGDALIGFSQGPPERQQVMAAVAKAPPGSFLATTPVGWVKGTAATISWEPAPEAFGNTTYAVLVDGRVVARGLTGYSLRIDPHGLGDGVHNVEVRATDSLGQQTLTAGASLKVDANPPEVSLQKLGHHRLQVRVFDRASGAVARDTSIAFGDGSSVTHKLSARHTYPRAGRYVIVVHSQDRVGNVLTAHLRVQIR